MSENNPIKEERRPAVILGVALTLALYLSGFFVILTPLPLVYIYLRDELHNFIRVAFIVFCIVILLYLFAFSPLYHFYQIHPQWSWLLPMPGMDFMGHVSYRSACFFGLYYYLFYVVLATVIGRVSLGQKNPYYFIGSSATFLFLVTILLFLFYAFIINQSLSSFLFQYFHATIKEVIKIQEESGVSFEQLAFLHENIDSFVKYSILIFPSAFYCYCLFALLINLLLARKLFATAFKKIKTIQLNQWSFSFYGVWGVIISMSLLLIHSYLLKSSVLFFLGANGLCILAFFYLLQGLLIVSYYLAKKEIRPLAFILIYGLIFLLFQIMGVILIGLGFFDSWYDFRKLKTPQKNENR